MTTQNWNFNERSQNQDIEFEGGANKVCEGCTVVLDHEGTNIMVQVQSTEGQTWCGKITSFPDNSDETMIGEMKIGGTIKFEDRHVIRCAA